MPTTTDNQLRKIAKSNLTVARIVDGLFIFKYLKI
jgi:hypothetical protein